MVRHDRAAGAGAENEEFFHHLPFSSQEPSANTCLKNIFEPNGLSIMAKPKYNESILIPINYI
jgi:hypothetical protein